MAILQTLIEKWVALYVRLSRDDENEGDSNSIAHQIEILTKYARDHGITNYKIYKRKLGNGQRYGVQGQQGGPGGADRAADPLPRDRPGA